ncbi:putative dehydrogenase [Streptomyces olivoverticillatus]|uniref:Putative dehydrogenase n=1 Tax=Streptomyces olivoverticillatus TaxID=66427 RepID=A0A7W7LPD5_9ACTN|nr:Gfo/Idh/MocA family oxidoreductase [Streptomyces olivoverticillatus]MBB4893964.1 putative dehydrogenase [Streptomyces olivoverticillatus]
MTPPLRFGVLGCAEFALRRMLPAMAQAEGVAITAVASRDGRKAKEAAARFGAAPVEGYEGLLERDDVDAVYVPLPAALHAEWVEKALLAGRHVLAEKPLTCDPARTAELLDLARERGLVLVENVLFVHHSQHTVVRNLVRDGAIGELRAFHAAFTVPAPAEGNIRLSRELGGGALWDVGIYPVRAAVHFLGDALEVVGAHLTTGAGREVDTAGAALLRAPGGVTAQLTFGMEHAYRNAYELHGSEGRITVERVFTPPADHHPLVRVETASGAEELRLDPDDQAVNALTAFAGAVRAGSAPGRDVRAEAVLLGAIRASAGGGHR